MTLRNSLMIFYVQCVCICVCVCVGGLDGITLKQWIGFACWIRFIWFI